MKKKIKILISQPVPGNLNSPFHDLAKKRNLNIVFNPFLAIEGETVKNIRLKKINIPVAPALIANSFLKGKEIAQELGFPLVIRPSFTLGGSGS